jgi:nucleoside-diphosphate-sugar epimerase
LTSERSGRRVVITGSSGEIGSRLVAHFAAAGWTVLGIDARPPGVETPPGVDSATCDLSKLRIKLDPKNFQLFLDRMRCFLRLKRRIGWTTPLKRARPPGQ